jgi:SAM-dependent methyltransferase
VDTGGATASDRVRALGLDAEQLAGKSILEVGSGDGEVCVAGLELGASRALGIELSAQRIQAARSVAAAAGRHAKFIEADFQNWEDGGEMFDIVICSGALRHMLDPIHALHRMMRLAQERLLVCFSVPTLREMRRFRISPGYVLTGGAGLIALGRSRYTDNIYNFPFALTPAAVRTILNQHCALFEPVAVRRTADRGRLVVANRRRIDHLTVIAGPTSSGKSTLYKHLDTMRVELGLPLRDSAYITASAARDLPEGRHEHVVLHYDLLRPFHSRLHSYERDIATDLISVAARVTFVTIVADRDRLCRQLVDGEIAGRSKPPSSRHTQLLQQYAAPAFLSEWYRRWLSFCEGFSGKLAGHFIVENRGGFVVKGTATTDLFDLFSRPDQVGF